MSKIDDEAFAAAAERIMNSTPLYCRPDETVTFNWGKPGTGFGQATFYYSAHTEGGDVKLYCDNERMSKDFIKEMLCQMVDEAEFTD